VDRISTELSASDFREHAKFINAVYCDVAPCGSCKIRRFGGTCRLHHQIRKNTRARKVLRLLLAAPPSPTPSLTELAVGVALITTEPPPPSNSQYFIRHCFEL
jgi:hypothetical protein